MNTMNETMTHRQKSQSKLAAKDFIIIGIFSAISFALMLVAAVANITPYTYLFYGAVFAFLNGPVYLVLTAKVPKKGAILLFHTVPFIYMMISNVFGMINAVLVVAFAVVAEVIVSRNRQSFKRLAVSYVILMFWESVGSLFFMFLMPEFYIEQMTGLGVDPVYVQTISMIAHNIGWWILAIAVTAVTSFLGVLAGKSIMKKHLQKAGIV